MISFASYNRYNNNILHDTLAVSFVNAVTSLLVGIFAFAVIGNIATEQNTSIEDVISDGENIYINIYQFYFKINETYRPWFNFRRLPASNSENASFTIMGSVILFHAVVFRIKQSGN